MLQTWKGIVLRAKDYGESHQILLVFTEHHGKQSTMARGSKKTKSRFGAVTEPLTEAQFICYTGSGMATLSQADIIHSHHAIRSDLTSTTYAAYWFELLDRLIPESEANPSLYGVLSYALSLLEKKTHPEILTRMIELRIMHAAGYQPILHQCLNCKKTERLTSFSVKHGGLLCSACCDLDTKAISVKPAVIRLLPLLQTMELPRLGKIELRTETEQQLKKIIHLFMDQHVDIVFKSRLMLDQINKHF